jgi:hypothetical protein
MNSIKRGTRSLTVLWGVTNRISLFNFWHRILTNEVLMAMQISRVRCKIIVCYSSISQSVNRYVKTNTDVEMPLQTILVLAKLGFTLCNVTTAYQKTDVAHTEQCNDSLAEDRCSSRLH